MNDPERLLDHSYDGIQEYDNPLPGWWVALFWASIIYSGFYYMYYEVGIGPSIHDEYGAETVAVYDTLAEKYADLEVTEEAIAAKMSEASFMSGMKSVYTKKCATCHGDSGEGNACPNLTDDYWLHGGDLMSIYAVIKDGVTGKEMKSWEQELGPLKLLGMAAYIGTLRGTHAPNGRDPEGQLFEPAEPVTIPAGVTPGAGDGSGR